MRGRGVQAGRNRTPRIDHRAVALCLMMVFLAGMASVACAEGAGQKGGRTFTDSDLTDYTRPSPREKAPEAKPAVPPVSPGEAQSRPKRFKVPYKPLEGSVRRIIISVTVNGSVTAPMLLDTGAPGMHISYDLAERLGIMSSREAKLIVPLAIGGKTSTALLTIIDSVEIGGAKDTFIPAHISAPLSKEFDGIIGLDFLANYAMSVDAVRSLMVLEELPARPEMPGGHDEQWWRSTFRDFGERRKAWERYREEVHRVASDSLEARDLRTLADRQVREAADLLGRLYRHASEFSVPMHWREY